MRSVSREDEGKSAPRREGELDVVDAVEADAMLGRYIGAAKERVFWRSRTRRIEESHAQELNCRAEKSSNHAVGLKIARGSSERVSAENRAGMYV